MVACAIEQFRVCPKPMIPTLEPEPSKTEGEDGAGALMRGMRGLGRPSRGRGRGRGRGGRIALSEEVRNRKQAPTRF